jgi:hypothetical protein
LLESVELFLIVWITNDNVTSNFVEFAEMIDFRYDILKREIFRWRSFGPFFFSVFIFLLSFFGSRFTLFRFWVVSRGAIFVLLDSPSNWLLLKINTNMEEDHRENILSVKKTSF